MGKDLLDKGMGRDEGPSDVAGHTRDKNAPGNILPTTPPPPPPPDAWSNLTRAQKENAHAFILEADEARLIPKVRDAILERLGLR